MQVSRRTFTQHLITTSAIAAAPAAVLKADDPPNDDKPGPPGADAKSTAPVDLVLELVKRFYPKNLDEAKLGQIRGQIEHHMSRSRVLSAIPLTNADEPATVFAAWRADK